MSAEILFIAHRIPFPPNRGDKIRSHHILRRLAQLAPVHVACFADDEADFAEERELAALAQSYHLVRRSKPLAYAGVQALVSQRPVSFAAFADVALADYVRQVLASEKVGTIYVFSGQMGQYLPKDYAGRVIVDFVDVDSAKFEAYAADRRGVMGWLHGREGRLLRKEEGQLAARAGVSLLISDKEAELFTSRLAGPLRRAARVGVLGNGIDSDFFDPSLACPEAQMAALPAPRLIFTGQMDYPPNIAAAERVATRILPLVRQHLPQASFHVVGRNPPGRLLARHGVGGVHVWGRVDDVRPWLKAANMAVAPLDIARGVQNKVLEAMAMGLPVVLTGAAATGIAAVPGQHFAIADSDAELAAAIGGLAVDAARARTLGGCARRFVVERQSWHSALAPLAGMVLDSNQEGRDAT